jgi:hypothetical protein
MGKENILVTRVKAAFCGNTKQMPQEVNRQIFIQYYFLSKAAASVPVLNLKGFERGQAQGRSCPAARARRQ